jgi:hypothetical protein
MSGPDESAGARILTQFDLIRTMIIYNDDPVAASQQLSAQKTHLSGVDTGVSELDKDFRIEPRVTYRIRT